MRAVVYYSARLRKSDREIARDLRRNAKILPKYIFILISKTANEEGLLYRFSEESCQILFVIGLCYCLLNFKVTHCILNCVFIRRKTSCNFMVFLMLFRKPEIQSALTFVWYLISTDL
jgi:hypothetical protein